MTLDESVPDDPGVVTARAYFVDVARAALAAADGAASDAADGLDLARRLVADIELSRACQSGVLAAAAEASDAPELLDAAIAFGRDHPPLTSRSLLDFANALEARGKADELVALLEHRDLDEVDPHVAAGLGGALVRAGATEAGRELTVTAAMRLLDQDDIEGTAETLVAAITAEPDALDLRLAYAKLLAAQQQFEPARVVLEAIAEASPEDAEVWAELAEMRRRVGQFDEALAALDEATRLGHDDTWVRGTRGQVLAALGRDAEALAEFDSVATPDAPAWVHISRAIVLLELEQPEAAIGAYSAAAASSPKEIAPLLGRARIEFDLGRYEAVLVTCEAAAARDPSDLAMLGLRAVALVMTQRYLEALGTLDRAIALDPSAARLRDRARVQYMLDQPYGARADLDQAAELEPPDASTLGLTAAVDLALGNAESSLESADAALAFEPESPLALAMKADALASLGRHDEALQIADVALPLVADDAWLAPRVHSVRAEVFFARQELDAAIEEAALAIETDSTVDRARLVWLRALDLQHVWEPMLGLVAPDPEDPVTGHLASWRVYALRRLGQVEDAVAEADVVLAVHPGDAETRWERLVALSWLDRWDELRTDSEIALADDELVGRPQFEYLHAVAVAGLGDLDDALSELDALTAAHPEYVEAAVRKIGYLLDLGRAEDALAAADTALATNDSSAELWNLRGLACSGLGRTEDALAAVEASITRDPSVAAVHGMRGKLLRELGNDEAALDAYERACALDPRVGSLQENRAELLRQDGRYIDALSALDIALDINPDSVYALGTRGQVLGALERYDEAVEALMRAATLSREAGAEPDAWIQEDLASNLSSAGRHEEALETLDQCAEHEPLSMFGRRLRGELLRVLGRADEAMAVAEELLAADPEDEIALGTKAQLLLDAGAPLDALTVLDQLFVVNAESDFGRRTQISALSWVNRFRDALTVLQEHFGGDEPDPWNAMAEAQLLQGLQHHMDAISVLAGHDEAMCLAPLGLSLARTGDLAGAIDALEDAVEDAEAEAWWFGELGDARILRAGRANDDARAAFEQGAELLGGADGSKPLVDVETAYCTFRLGQLDAARAKYESVVASRPYLLWERLLLGMILTLQSEERADASIAAAQGEVDNLDDHERAAGMRAELAWVIEAMVVDATIAHNHPLVQGPLGTWARAGRRQEVRRGR